MTEFVTAYGPKVKVRNPTEGESRTKGSFLEETDINHIMAKYQRTGLVSHLAKHQPRYGEASGMEFRDAMQIVVEAQEMFDDLPSSVRKRFGNDPAVFLDYVSDPDNVKELEKLGLVAGEPEPATNEPGEGGTGDSENPPGEPGS